MTRTLSSNSSVSTLGLSPPSSSLSPCSPCYFSSSYFSFNETDPRDESTGVMIWTTRLFPGWAWNSFSFLFFLFDNLPVLHSECVEVEEQLGLIVPERPSFVP
ncbi:hypothetical protein MAP00_001621 [Monascus purpureus]|nr:hypothetical protein MAP00_001621 [Monascus purpureus]